MGEVVRFRFGDYVVSPSTRSVLKKEEPQTPEPKVFDTLVFLITHRGRVVTKQELLDAVWGTQVVVTEGVVARTIMKARRLIGDDADEPAIIKTVHRVGYRFVMTVEEDPLSDSKNGHHVQAMRVHGPALVQGSRIAILPFRNHTGSLDLAWFDLGLMSTTIDAVAMTPGINVVPAADLLALVGPHETGLDLQTVASKITRALGASEIVQAEVTRDREGELTLGYLCTGPRLSSLQGSLSGFDPIDLSRQLAAKIVRCVSVDEDSPRTGRGPLASALVKDTQFAQIAHGRAMQAIHIERWEYARKLLQVALDIAPDDPTLRLDFARCLVWQRDPEVEPLLRRFLEEAQAASDETLELRVLHLLAVHLHGRGKIDEAERLLSWALEIAEAQQDQAAELQLLVSIADTLTNEGRVAVASWMIDRASQVARALGNQVTIAHLHDIRGRIAMFTGDEQAALEAFSEAAMLSEQYGIHTNAAFSVAHVGTCLLGMGRMIDASECFDRSFRHACESGHPVCVGLTGICVVRFGGLWRGDVTHAGTILDKLRQVSIGNSILVQGCADLAEAFVAARRGDLQASLALLERAEAEVVHTRGLAYHALRHRIRVLVCLGRLDDATALCDGMQSRAAGRLKKAVRGTVLHNRGLIARADGMDAEALQLLERSIVELPPSIERADAALDVAWLHLEAGDHGRARRALSGFTPFMDAALASEYGPAMLVQARMLFEDVHAEGELTLCARRGLTHDALTPFTCWLAFWC